MVDNRDNWEDTEYIEDLGDEQSFEYEDAHQDSGDYSGQNDDSEYEEYEEYEDEEDEEQSKKSNPLPMLIILILLLGVGAFIVIPKFMSGSKIAAGKMNENSGMLETVQVQNADELTNAFFEGASVDDSSMISVDFNEKGEANVATGEDNNVATVVPVATEETAIASDLFENQEEATNIKQEENNSIMVVYKKAARMNPFKPPTALKIAEEYGTIENAQFEIIEPPVDSVPDENLTRLLQTQISGILYEKESPSAIVNINGSDQFVKVGDVVFGYKVENITKRQVEISYKNNSYVASVGELFTKGSLEKSPAIVNLENKFAGRNNYENN